MMSRNPHEPTPESREQVRALAAVGLPQEDIATLIGCSEKTLRLYYRTELDEGLEEANAVILDTLFQLIDRGNTTAMIFYEKCKGGKRETIKEEINVSNMRHQYCQTLLDNSVRCEPRYFHDEPERLRYQDVVIISPCRVDNCDPHIEREIRFKLNQCGSFGARDPESQIQLIRAEMERIKANVGHFVLTKHG